jgi:hypothetical protein
MASKSKDIFMSYTRVCTCSTLITYISVFSQSPVVLATYWLFESPIVSLREQNLISTVQGPENQGTHRVIRCSFVFVARPPRFLREEGDSGLVGGGN